MRINQIAVKGFIGIHDIDINPVEDLTLICGFNETGKTSLQQAIGFAMRGIPERVKLKKNFGELVNDDYEVAEIMISTDVDAKAVRIRKKDGKTDGLPNPENVSEFLHNSLDMTFFTSMDAASRRRAIFRLSGTSAAVDQVLELLQKAGANVNKANTLKNILIAGFDAGAKTAKDNTADARASWKAIAGENYGSDKAEHWNRPFNPVDGSSDDLSAELKQKREDASSIKSKIDQSAGRASQRAQIEKQTDEIVLAGPLLDELIELEKTAYAEAVELDAKIATLKGRLSALITGEAPDNVYVCPCCDTNFVLENNSLEAYSKAEDTTAKQAEVESEISALQKEHDYCHTALSQLSNGISQRNLKAELEKSLLSLGKDEMDAVAAQSQLDVINAEVQVLNDKLATLIESERINEQAEKDNAAAQRHHNDVVEWSFIEKQLKPEGIPSILMAKSLDPINQALKEQADTSGWPLVKINTDMLITYGERSLDLVSESAKWRTQAMLAAAISHIANIGFILLDRADVLDLNGRSQMLSWAEALNKKGIQTIICATLKQPPNIDGIKTVWLGGSI